MADEMLWERVCCEEDMETHRLRVPGGWVVRVVTEVPVVASQSEFTGHYASPDHYPVAPSLCFVADPGHTWTLDEGGE